MSRVIKFRGIHKGDWVHGCYVTDYKNYHAIVADSMKNDEMLNQHVDAETVGQLTGLKDKNGVEIYEGDILAGGVGYGNMKQPIEIVEWSIKTHWSGMADGYIVNHVGFNIDEYYITLKKCEIIGNIHEDKNLIDNI